MTQHDRIGDYLLGLSRLCLEVAREPWLLPLFVQLVALVPATIAALRREERRRLVA
jgi:hypothetical protein